MVNYLDIYSSRISAYDGRTWSFASENKDDREKSKIIQTKTNKNLCFIWPYKCESNALWDSKSIMLERMGSSNIQLLVWNMSKLESYSKDI